MSTLLLVTIFLPLAGALALSLVALAAATYLTVAHYTSPKVLACSASGRVNCEAVTTSAQSTFLGIPVAVLERTRDDRPTRNQRQP